MVCSPELTKIEYFSAKFQEIRLRRSAAATGMHLVLESVQKLYKFINFTRFWVNFQHKFYVNDNTNR